MHKYLMDLLCCPRCYGELGWSVKTTVGGHIEEGSAKCSQCHAAYPVGEGIGVFLTSELERQDLWEDVESNLTHMLKNSPRIETQLMDAPLDSLNPADQMFRAMILDERGDFARAEVAEETAHQGLYTTDYLRCWQNQVRLLLERLGGSNEPILDLASGRCYLVGRMASLGAAPIIASDFSIRVLRRDRHWLEWKGFYDRISLLAFDARRIPFKNLAVRQMTTNLGLANIREPAQLFKEIRRVVSGKFYSITSFYPEKDANRQAIEQIGLACTLYKEKVIEEMTKAGLQVEIYNRCEATAKPTATGVVLKGMGVDNLPVAETELEWCLMEAS